MVLRLASSRGEFYIRLGGVRWKNYHPGRKERPHGTKVPPTTDIEVYKTLDTSHLHRWNYQDTLRSFNLKYAKLVESSSSVHKSIQKPPLSKPQTLSISPYVPRSPSDILKSIASGLKRDHSAPDYRFHDDPYLIPYNHISSRDYVLGKEAGKAAARFVFEHHPQLFTENRIEMVPKIPSFLPKVRVDPKKVTHETLIIFLKGNQIPEAIETYNALENVNESLKFDLLQKTAYFADKEPVLTDEHANTYGLYQDSPMPWKEGGFAEKLARDLKDQIAAKCALLYGFSRHGRYEDCILMFEELKGEEAVLPCEAYNAYLRSHIEDSLKNKVSFSQLKLSTSEILKEMCEKGIKPDARTLYWILRGISKCAFKSEDYSETCEHVLSLISEFKNNLNVVPSVGSYNALINIFYPKNISSSDILRDIIAELEETDLYIVDPEESTFLKTAMFLCFLKLSDPTLAWRLHKKITLYGNNQVLLNNANEHQAYYNYFLTLQLSSSSFKSAMDFYEKFTPNLFFCFWSNYEKIVLKIERFGEYKYLPSIWSDLVINNFCRVNIRIKYEMIDKILAILEKGGDFKEVDDEEARVQIIKSSALIAKDTFSDFIISLRNLSDIKEISSIISSIFKITLDKGPEHIDAYLNFADSIMNFVIDKTSDLSSPPFSEEVMQLYFDKSLEQLRKESCLKAVNYASRNGLENKLRIGRTFVEKYELTEREAIMLNTMFSHENEWSPIKLN
uniref:Uncharacterized protein n=1 Tax=Lepeophtheirus salmonis TaxID=72036 RepID=A0A0K2UUD3_LEPSM